MFLVCASGAGRQRVYVLGREARDGGQNSGWGFACTWRSRLAVRHFHRPRPHIDADRPAPTAVQDAANRSQQGTAASDVQEPATARCPSVCRSYEPRSYDIDTELLLQNLHLFCLVSLICT